MASLTFTKWLWQYWKLPFKNLYEILYRNYKNFDISTFKNVLRLKLQSIKSYECFEQVFLEVLNNYGPLKKRFLRANHAPYVYHTWSHYAKPLWGGQSLKASILKLGPLKIKLNIRNKRIFVVNFIKRNGKNSTQT